MEIFYYSSLQILSDSQWVTLEHLQSCPKATAVMSLCNYIYVIKKNKIRYVHKVELMHFWVSALHALLQFYTLAGSSLHWEKNSCSWKRLGFDCVDVEPKEGQGSNVIGFAVQLWKYWQVALDDLMLKKYFKPEDSEASSEACARLAGPLIYCTVLHTVTSMSKAKSS